MLYYNMASVSTNIVNLQEKIRMIKIPKNVYDNIINIIEKHYPLEACGVLLGKIENETAKVVEVKEIKNVLESTSMFWFDIKEWMNVILEAKERKLEYIGLFHSHIKGSPIPSLPDRHRMLECPEEVWIIVSYKLGTKPDIAAWRINDFGSSIMKLRLEIK
ncbi:hypothetical protein B6U96_03135 [Archaeoglobales archaeon ex4484_92]|nr:MAG: hypothetical protein B6U96_03135 [Archaeoglobales archaeon ex4484_92]